jgi:hypothetical protein
MGRARSFAEFILSGQSEILPCAQNGLRMTAQRMAELPVVLVFTFDFCALHFDLFLPSGRRESTANRQSRRPNPEGQ